MLGNIYLFANHQRGAALVLEEAANDGVLTAEILANQALAHVFVGSSEAVSAQLLDEVRTLALATSDPRALADVDRIDAFRAMQLGDHEATGLVRLLSGPLDAYHGLSPEQANAYSSFPMTPRSLQTWLDEGKGMPQSLAQVGAVTNLGATPLIVLSRGQTLDPDQDWQRMQTEFLGLSSSSQQLFANQSGHNVEFDQPEAAVGAIEKMLELTRRGNG